MMRINALVQPTTAQGAYDELIASRRNAVLGGCGFLRMGNKIIAKGIDLSDLDLDYIKEDDSYVEIGAMTSFRTLETSEIVMSHFGTFISEALKHIVGVQFRNNVTVGASIFSKYGFSDLITTLLVLETEVELVKGGRLPLESFLDQPRERDILTRVYIKKSQRQSAYQCIRKSKTDFPVINCAVSQKDKAWTLVVGSRPGVAKIAKKASQHLTETGDIEKSIAIAMEELSFGSNMRGSAEYRTCMSGVLLERCIKEVKA